MTRQIGERSRAEPHIQATTFRKDDSTLSKLGVLQHRMKDIFLNDGQRGPPSLTVAPHHDQCPVPTLLPLPESLAVRRRRTTLVLQIVTHGRRASEGGHLTSDTTAVLYRCGKRAYVYRCMIAGFGFA